MKQPDGGMRITAVSVLALMAIGLTSVLAALNFAGIINVSWWVVTAPVWIIPVITVALVLVSLTLLGPDIIKTYRSESAYRRSIRQKIAEFLRRPKP